MAPGEAEPAALPRGAKDVLPVEADELRAIESGLRAVVMRFGYREISTPVLELASVLDRAQEGGLESAYRLFDDTGRVLVLRPDLTIPAARLVATRMAEHPGPVRITYSAPAFRPPPQGRAAAAEQRQAGIELVGLSGPEADAEVLAVLVQGLRAVGLDAVRVGVADVSLTMAALEGLGVPAGPRRRLEAALRARNLAEWRRLAAAAELRAPRAELLAELPGLRGGPELLDRVTDQAPQAAPAATRLRRVLDLAAAHGVGDALMVDLGVARDWPYYSGIVLEAYAPGSGVPLAMGGRYDGLGGRFGRERPAVGWAIALDALHRALRAEPSGANGTRPGVVLAAGLDDELATAAALRAAGVPVAAVAGGAAEAEALARAEGWRFAAAPGPRGYALRDLESGEELECSRLGEEVASRLSS